MLTHLQRVSSQRKKKDNPKVVILSSRSALTDFLCGRGEVIITKTGGEFSVKEQEFSKFEVVESTILK